MIAIYNCERECGQAVGCRGKGGGVVVEREGTAGTYCTVEVASSLKTHELVEVALNLGMPD